MSIDFYDTDEWRHLRYEAFERYGNRCLACGRTAAHDLVMHVDHIKPRSKYPELALDIENLQVLCEDCNLAKSNIFETDWRVYYHHQCAFVGITINEFMPEILQCRCFSPTDDFLTIQDRWAVKLSLGAIQIVHREAA